MKQHPPVWINLLFIFLLVMGADLLKQVITNHFRFIDLLQVLGYLFFLLFSFFIRQLPAIWRRFLIGTVLFIGGGILSLLFENPFELAAWTLYLIGAFFGAFLWDHFCQGFSIRWLYDKIIR